MPEMLTRRQFLTAVAVVAGGAVVYDLSRGLPDFGGEDEQIETPSESYGGETTMGKRVLVGYATRTGSTVGVAEAIGKTLGERGFAVDVKPLKERPSLDGYDAVVLGSAVNGGAWLPEAVRFVESNAKALRSIPTALFCVHIMNLGADEKASTKRRAYLDPVRRMITPSDEGYFAGKGPTSEDTSLIARWAFKAFGGGGEGDCRDWNAIAAWARQTSV